MFGNGIDVPDLTSSCNSFSFPVYTNIIQHLEAPRYHFYWLCRALIPFQAYIRQLVYLYIWSATPILPRGTVHLQQTLVDLGSLVSYQLTLSMSNRVYDLHLCKQSHSYRLG